MHEVSLVSTIVDQIEELSQKENFSRVKAITLEVGILSGVEPLALEFCFSEVTKNSVLENSILEIEKTPIEVLCQHCHQISILNDIWDLTCPHCQSSETKILKGKEFRILDIEVYPDQR